MTTSEWKVPRRRRCWNHGSARFSRDQPAYRSALGYYRIGKKGVEVLQALRILDARNGKGCGN